MEITQQAIHTATGEVCDDEGNQPEHDLCNHGVTIHHEWAHVLTPAEQAYLRNLALPG